MITSRTHLAAAFLALALGAPAAASESGPGEKAPPPRQAKDPAGELIQATPPPFSEGIFPCTQCHNDPKVDTSRRQLAFHDEIQDQFNHDSQNRWCLDCHDARNRDVLHLSSGAAVPFTESYLLCGQCHGDKYRDWRAGVHGKRIGHWDGQKTYFLCVHCHNPHAPRFKGIAPEPRPRRPEEMKR